jgi:hypothetical protein
MIPILALHPGAHRSISVWLEVDGKVSIRSYHYHCGTVDWRDKEEIKGIQEEREYRLEIGDNISSTALPRFRSAQG